MDLREPRRHRRRPTSSSRTTLTRRRNPLLDIGNTMSFNVSHLHFAYQQYLESLDLEGRTRFSMRSATPDDHPQNQR